MNRVERFRGRTPGEAMKKARETLGEEARLVHARRVSTPDDPVPAYEVTATVNAGAETPVASLAGIRRELEELKELVRAQSGAGAAVSAPAPAAPPTQETRENFATVALGAAPRETLALDAVAWIERLGRRGMARATAERLVRVAQQHGAANGIDLGAALATAVVDDIAGHTSPGRIGARSTIVVGPTGAGKTTTLAKIAAELVARGVRPILATTDGESVSGEDTLARVAGALELRFETAFFSGQLADLADRLGPRDIVLVDTPGRSPWSADGLAGLDEVVRALDDAEVLLVVPATSDEDELRAIAQAYEVLGVHRVVVTKLDEMARPARFIDLVRAMTRPVAWVTSGRESRGAAFDPTDPAFAARLVRTRGAVEAQA